MNCLDYSGDISEDGFELPGPCADFDDSDLRSDCDIGIRAYDNDQYHHQSELIDTSSFNYADELYNSTSSDVEYITSTNPSVYALLTQGQDAEKIGASIDVSVLLIAVVEQYLKMCGANQYQVQKIIGDIIKSHFQQNTLAIAATEEFSPVRNSLGSDFTHVIKAILEHNGLSIMSTMDAGPKLPTQLKFCFSNRMETFELSSHYRKEFEEIGFLGDGGFGSVFKAVHKVDRNTYAIKKIRIRHEDVETVFREVRVLSRLEHPNIVRYNSAWLECEAKDDMDTVSASTASPLTSHLSTNEDELSGGMNINFNEIHSNTNDSEDSDGIVFELNSSIKSDGKSNNNKQRNCSSIKRAKKKLQTSLEKSIIQSKRKDRSQQLIRTLQSISHGDISSSAKKMLSSKMYPSEVSLSSLSKSVSHSSGSPSFHRSTSMNDALMLRKTITSSSFKGVYSGSTWSSRGISPSNKIILYIQMRLCNNTLKNWLHQRNDEAASNGIYTVNTAQNTRIFKQILNGIDHIHSHGLIHRDIKPHNIFFVEDADGQVMIGDFGLATLSCEINDDFIGKADYLNINEDLTSGVGTRLYASPEQISGSNYGNKADIYSLGVILFELYQIFGTDMERTISISNMRDGDLPDGFAERWPEESEIILWMTKNDPKQRPSAKEIIHAFFSKSPDQIISSMEQQLKQKDEDIARLGRTTRELNVTVERLQSQLEDKDREILLLRRQLEVQANMINTSDIKKGQSNDGQHGTLLKCS